MGIRTYSSLRVIAAFVAWSCGLSACAPGGSDGKQKFFQTGCSLASDQSASLYGRWKKVAVPIVFRVGQWTNAEMQLIMDAADVWNAFFKANGGGKAIDYGSRSSPNLLGFNKPAGDICGFSIYDDVSARYTSGVMIYKQAAWPYASLSSAIALTSFCKRNGAGNLPQLFMAVMEANYQNFFTAGKKQPDLKSIFVHEFGHLLGLDHSCSASETSANAGLAFCGNVQDAKPAYKDAAMYPTVFFFQDGTSLVKDELQENDQIRANCLYGGAAL